MKRLTLAICLLALTSLEGTEMKTAKFRDVLWSVARKAGYSPESGNFISNQAIPIGEYINDWVGRLYAQEDWPEWTKIIRCTPNASHIVPYEAVTGNVFSTNPFKIGRVLTVYLVDPSTTRAPISTRFTLREEGIHCGYEHGTYVWIKYIEPAPEFTAAPWRAEITYAKDEPVYVPDTGDCYRSMINNNRGHNPVLFSSPPRQLTLDVTQDSIPDSPGRGAQNQIVRLYFQQVNPPPAPLDPPVNLGLFGVAIDDETGTTIASTSDAGDGVKTIADIMGIIRTALLAGLPGGWTLTNNTTDKTMDIENDSNFALNPTGNAYIDPSDPSVVHYLKSYQVQPYIPAFSSAGGQPQIMQLTFTDDDVVAGGEYILAFSGDDGILHSVSYTALDTDAVSNIIEGLLAAISAEIANDSFFERISVATAGSVITFTTRRTVGLNPTLERPVPPPEGGLYWRVVPFPDALFIPVVRGASGTLLGEWGQGDAQTREEGKVPAETQINSGDFETTPTPPLTTQQRALSRYKL